jgi:hypothetical protein
VQDASHGAIVWYLSSPRERVRVGAYING